MRELKYLQALREGLWNEMKRDSSIYVMGENIRLGINKLTEGFYKEFGDNKVINSPKSEATLISSATGASMIGMRPVIELQMSDFVFLSFSALIDQAAKLRYISGGKLSFPVTYIIIEYGTYKGFEVQHSDNPYSFLIHGGMKVAVPSDAYDAKGLLVSAIRDDDPVAVFLPARVLADKGDVPEDQYTVPLGKGEIKRIGSDITVVATGHLVKVALDVAEKLDRKGISIEVFDPRTLLPFDKKTLEKSVSKTGKVVIIDDSPISCGFASMVSSILMEECFEYLKAPIKRIARADVPVPFSQTMEEYVLPNEMKLVNAIKTII